MQHKIISNEQFKEKAKTWLNHKLILAKSSQWYKVHGMPTRIEHLKNIFFPFLSLPNQYSVCQLAVHIKKHEDLLFAVLPMPGNPSYENALAMLTNLIEKATEIIETNQLQTLLK